MTYQRSCDLTPGKHKLFSYGQGDTDYCNIFVDVSAMRYIFFYCKKSSINMTCHSRRVFYGLLKIGGGVKDKWEVDVNNVPLPELNTFSFNKRDYIWQGSHTYDFSIRFINLISVNLSNVMHIVYTVSTFWCNTKTGHWFDWIAKSRDILQLLSNNRTWCPIKHFLFPI